MLLNLVVIIISIQYHDYHENYIKILIEYHLNNIEFLRILYISKTKKKKNHDSVYILGNVTILVNYVFFKTFLL